MLKGNSRFNFNIFFGTFLDIVCPFLMCFRRKIVIVLLGEYSLSYLLFSNIVVLHGYFHN